MSAKNKVKLLGLFTVLSVLVGIYYARVTEALLEIGDAEAEAYLTTAVYSALGQAQPSGEAAYCEFFSVAKDKDGNVAYILTDGVAVNSFTRDISVKVMENLKNNSTRGVSVPAGVFTGIKLFAGMGKSVNVRILEITSARCDLVSEFRSAGINQVNHTLYAKVVPEVTLKAMGRTRKFNVEVSVMIYDNLIVGKVPEIYLNSVKGAG